MSAGVRDVTDASGGDAGTAGAVATPLVDRVLRLVRLRMRINRVLTAAGPALLAAATAVLGWMAVARFVPVARPDPVALAVIAVIVALICAAAAIPPLPDRWTAWAADRWLGLPETFATTLELREGRLGQLAGEHIRRAEDTARDIHRLPDGPRVPVRLLTAALVVALLAGGVAALGDPQRASRERAAREEAAVAAQADALREAADDLARGDEPQRQAAQRLRDVAEELEDADLETALERLQAAQQRLDDRSAGELAAQRTALAGLERVLQAAPLAAGDSAAAQLDQLADDLATGDIDAEEAGQIADRLEQLAQALGGQPELAGALTEAAGMMRSGTAGAAGALSSAAGAVTAAEQGLAEGEANAQAAGSVASAADALRAAQEPGDGSTDQRQGQGQGQAQGQGQGQGQGDGAGRGGQGGQGAQGGQGGQGARASGQQRDGRSAGGGAGGDEAARDQPSGTLDTQTVYDPRRREAGPGEDLQIQGRDTGDQPETTKGVSQGAGQRNPALVPYQDVLTDYAQRATRTVEQPGYPARLRDTVRDYFDGLAGRP